MRKTYNMPGQRTNRTAPKSEQLVPRSAKRQHPHNAGAGPDEIIPQYRVHRPYAK